MRHRMWTPLPPERSGIADYSFELLETMAGLADVAAVSRYPGDARAPEGVPVLGPDDVPPDDDAVDVYQMGNNTEFHEWIHRRALAVPGLVVLHDPSLLDFSLSYFGGIESPRFKDELAHAHGPIWGDPADPALVLGWPAVDVDGVKHLDRQTMSLERRIVSASRGVLVHDPFRAGQLRERYPEVPVFTVASAAPVVEDDAKRPAVRAKLGWTGDEVVFGVFGGFTAIKRIRVAVLAFAQVRRRWPQAKLLIVGHAREKDIEADVHRTIAELGVGDAVRIIPSPDIDEFQDLIVATDALIGLRWPTAGETSAVMMRAFGIGRLFITSDLPQHRHYDREFCRLVPIDPRREAVELAAHLERVVSWPEEARDAGRKAREYVRRHASWPVVAAAYRDAAESVRGPVPPPVKPSRERPGVNVFGDVRAAGVRADATRRLASVLTGRLPRSTFTEFNSRVPDRPFEVPRQLADQRRGKDYATDLWLVDAPEFPLIPQHSFDRYTIAWWAGELPDLPATGLPQLSDVDELWVPSTLAAGLVRGSTDIPVTVVPKVVPVADGTGDRARFRLPEAGLVVLTTFHSSSDAERKNFRAAITAFRRAFPAGGAHLAVAAIDLDPASELADWLDREVTAIGGTVLGGRLPEEDRGLLLASCDIYLSLHRFETFGLDMAEAMARRKPVVATGHGGNLDFMPLGAAALVGYETYVAKDAEPGYTNGFTTSYPLGHPWAEPDLGQAVQWLRKLAANAGLRTSMGERAAEAVAAVCGPDAVEAVVTRRLAAVPKEPARRP
ncbi:glycosyltransferase [Amycolatopsis sp. NPDC088138]|uniref:glycosyltransferase n=1 Tax=Amycolatopsis sp. NPDC088138 TaxID=3363938 RepID=UPI00382905D3